MYTETASSQLARQLLDVWFTGTIEAQSLQDAQLAEADRQACHLAIGHVKHLQIAEVAEAQGEHDEFFASGQIQLLQVTQPAKSVW